MQDSEDITGFRFSVLGREASVRKIASWLDDVQSDGPRYFVCAPTHSVEQARRDPEFADAIHKADLVTPDGVGIVLASRINGGRIHERVCGPDLLIDLCRTLDRERPGTRMFFLGSSEERLRALAETIRREFPSLVVTGIFAPPFRSEFSAEENTAMIDAVNHARPDVLWIGLGAPKQEKWAFRHRQRLNVRMIGPVGAAFDFVTGHVSLGPRWVQRSGLIWLYRFFQQPKRLWRRNLDNPIFLCRVLSRRLWGVLGISRRRGQR